MFAAYFAWQGSGSSRDYFDVFGAETFVTGVGAVWCLIIIFAAVSPILIENHKWLFGMTHGFWVVFIILMFIHGKTCLGGNFWKFMIGPLGLYIMDRLFRSGGFAALRIR